MIERNKKSYQYVLQWRKKTKQELINALGGCCCICGYDKCIEALDLHHIDHTTKSYSISQLLSHPQRQQIIIDEAKKCCVLCSNCHREIHNNITQLPNTLPQFDITKITPLNQIVNEERQCLFCKSVFVIKHSISKKYCCEKCRRMASRKIDRPSKQILRQQISQFGFTHTGRLYGVTDNAIKKWLK